MSVEKPEVLSVSNIVELQKILLQFGVQYSLWYGERKNENHLLEEIQNEETELVHDPEHGLVRQTRVLNLEVRYKDQDGREYILIEEKQVWHTKTDASGELRVDRRGHRHISEKITASNVRADDTVTTEVIQRSLSEELGGVSNYEDLLPLGTTVEYKNSPSFPGLKTKYILYQYRVYLPPQEYRPEYVEVGAEKSTYFTWEELPQTDDE